MIVGMATVVKAASLAKSRSKEAVSGELMVLVVIDSILYFHNVRSV